MGDLGLEDGYGWLSVSCAVIKDWGLRVLYLEVHREEQIGLQLPQTRLQLVASVSGIRTTSTTHESASITDNRLLFLRSQMAYKSFWASTILKTALAKMHCMDASCHQKFMTFRKVEEQFTDAGAPNPCTVQEKHQRNSCTIPYTAHVENNPFTPNVCGPVPAGILLPMTISCTE